MPGLGKRSSSPSPAGTGLYKNVAIVKFEQVDNCTTAVTGTAKAKVLTNWRKSARSKRGDALLIL